MPTDIEIAQKATMQRIAKVALLELGLADSVAVMLSNMAMDQDRKVQFNEIDKLGLPGAPAKKVS